MGVISGGGGKGILLPLDPLNLTHLMFSSYTSCIHILCIHVGTVHVTALTMHMYSSVYTEYCFPQVMMLLEQRVREQERELEGMRHTAAHCAALERQAKQATDHANITSTQNKVHVWEHT